MHAAFELTKQKKYNYVGVQVWTRACILHKQHGGACGGPAHLPAGYAVHIVDITCLCCSFIVRFCERAEVLLLERQRIAQPGVLNKCRIIERVKMVHKLTVITRHKTNHIPCNLQLPVKLSPVAAEHFFLIIIYLGGSISFTQRFR